MRVFYYKNYRMRHKYNINLTKEEFKPVKYSIPLQQNWNFRNSIFGTDRIHQKLNRKLMYDIDNISIENRCSLSLLLEEPLKNSFDACKDKYIKNNKFVWKITINIIHNTKKNVITIIIKDNWAWIKASTSKEKRKDSNFLWWAWKWLKQLWKNHRLEKDYNWATIILKQNID